MLIDTPIAQQATAAARDRQRVVNTVQLCAAAVDGTALSTVVLHATGHLGLTSTAIGVVLALAGAAALVGAVPLGALADRLGLRRSATLYGLGSAAALIGYATADSLAGYAAAAVLFGVAQAASTSVRHALAVEYANPLARLNIRASMHTLLNVGFGLGTVIGGIVAAIGSEAAFRCVYGAAAVVAALAAVATLALPTTTTTLRSDAHHRGHGVLTALRDKRFAAATALASAISLTMPTLSILIPAWVLVSTDAPVWIPGAALAVNTVIVICSQKAWAARIVSPSAAARSAYVAGAALLVSCVLLSTTSATMAPASAATVVIAAVVFLSVGEIAGGAATWYVALRDIPQHAEGRYQSAFSMSSSAARIVGPGIALPLVTSVAIGGWIALGVVMSAACIGVAALARPSFNRGGGTEA